MLRIINFRVPLDDDASLKKLIANKTGILIDDIESVDIVRKAVDARRKNNISLVYSFDVKLRGFNIKQIRKLTRDKDIEWYEQGPLEDFVYGTDKMDAPPVVIGAGPAGLLAALKLAQCGYKPAVFERGRSVEQRAEDVKKFWLTGHLEPNSNIQFGEGGAGTFSDGKLTTRVKDDNIREVLDEFIIAGAPQEIKYHYKPHIGTDLLRKMVKNIRNKIIEYGGTIAFETQVVDFIIQDGRITELVLSDGKRCKANVVVVATGHSARDTYEVLYSRGVAMTAKPFAIGVRVEHAQSIIDYAQYGELAGHEKLKAADYGLVYHDKKNNRTAYSFCMCPGGQVVAGASELGGVATNGMSFYARDSGIANSALVVNVHPQDCGSTVLSGIEFQRYYERRAFVIAGENYFAPIQTIKNFLTGCDGGGKSIKPTYRPGTAETELRQCLPSFVTDTIASALPDFGRKIKGFDSGEVYLTGVETRTSAPVRILRNEKYESVNTTGLYPVGEGAGYAGGIMSAAVDGLKVAFAIMEKYQQG